MQGWPIFRRYRNEGKADEKSPGYLRPSRNGYPLPVLLYLGAVGLLQSAHTIRFLRRYGKVWRMDGGRALLEGAANSNTEPLEVGSRRLVAT